MLRTTSGEQRKHLEQDNNGMNNKWIGVVGYPLKQSLSKQIQEENIRSHRRPWKFKILEWKPEEFERNIRELKQDATCVGFSVTMPFKEKIISYLDSCDDWVRKIRAVNCVKNKNGQWHGTNTDAPGFLHHFKQWNPLPPKTVKIIVMGIGATGRTLSFSLAEAGYKNFVLINRTFEKAQEWGGKLRHYFPEIRVEIEKWGDPSLALKMTNVFILNTTPLGMKGEGLDWIEISKLQNPVWIFDVAYNPPQTLLNGWPMFQEQANLAFKIWMS